MFAVDFMQRVFVDVRCVRLIDGNAVNIGVEGYEKINI